MAGKYEVGLDMHGNRIRLSEGTCIELEETGRIQMRYRGGRREFLNGQRCVAFLDMNGAGAERAI
jgi:hypothetical protein